MPNFSIEEVQEWTVGTEVFFDVNPNSSHPGDTYVMRKSFMTDEANRFTANWHRVYYGDDDENYWTDNSVRGYLRDSSSFYNKGVRFPFESEMIERLEAYSA